MTLVLAGAGTGKTSVIVGKVAHLVRNQDVSPNEILVLAFNKKAAAEIRGRLAGDLSAAHVYTFNSFGNRIIANSEDASPNVSELAEDKVKRESAVEETLHDIMRDPQQSEAVIDFIAYHHAPYSSAFDFKTRAEYDEYIRSVELRTLSGDLVKSFEELYIANFLTEYGIEFRYEAPYKVQTATRSADNIVRTSSSPNMTFTSEHFALDEEDRPRPAWKEYAQGVKWKRGIHKQHGSKLIETYSWQRRQDNLLPQLREQLEEAGVPFARVPHQTLIGRLVSQLISWLASCWRCFLTM